MLDTAQKRDEQRRWMRAALHEISQPLTTLECCLYVGTMDNRGTPPTADEMRSTLAVALVECGRLTSRIRAMHERLNEDDEEL